MDQAGSTHAPTCSSDGGAWPSSHHGSQLAPWPASEQAASGSGSVRSQNSVQQPLAPAQPGTASAAAHQKPGSHELRNSHGSPTIPMSPDASTMHTKPSAPAAGKHAV